MKTVAKDVLVLVAASTFGLVLAMTAPQSASADNGAALEGYSATVTGANSQSDLVSSVDWSKIKQEPTSPTF
jgi:hypothetical protein